MAPERTACPWLTGFAALTALATLGLIALGGLVTSHGAGMAVPDWPTTYGYNMFLFPVSQWVGGVFYEHTHRLYASGVGLLTVVLAVWLQLKAPGRRLARWGWVAVGLVVIQGVLGGLRVSLMKDQIGIVHGALAQAFLVLLVLITLGLTPRWRRWMELASGQGRGSLGWAAAATGLIFVQLLLGATMRHQHAGLAVPDFPLAYHSAWPPTDEAFLQQVNASRTDTRDFHPITAFQIQLHMAHRLLGLGLGLLVWETGRRLRREFGNRSPMGRLGQAWRWLIVGQILLGASTVWSNKAADVATAHVVLGASCLVLGVMVVAFCRGALRYTARADSPARVSPTGGFREKAFLDGSPAPSKA